MPLAVACFDYGATDTELGEEMPETVHLSRDNPLKGTESGTLKSQYMDSSCGRSEVLPEQLGVVSSCVFLPSSPRKLFQGDSRSSVFSTA